MHCRRCCRAKQGASAARQQSRPSPSHARGSIRPRVCIEHMHNARKGGHGVVSVFNNTRALTRAQQERAHPSRALVGSYVAAHTASRGRSTTCRRRVPNRWRWRCQKIPANRGSRYKRALYSLNRPDEPRRLDMDAASAPGSMR